MLKKSLKLIVSIKIESKNENKYITIKIEELKKADDVNRKWEIKNWKNYLKTIEHEINENMIMSIWVIYWDWPDSYDLGLWI